MVSVKQLRIDYEGVTAVSDLTFEVKAGQIYGLVGPNGAGKTSTLKALAGLLEPTYGEIRIADFDLESNLEKALAHVGFMPDFPPVYEHLKVWEYLDVFAAAYRISRNDRLPLVREWLARVGLSEKQDAYVHTLSRGMRQRLVLAKTLLHNPGVILLDEPASGLDPIARLDLRNILKNIAAQGKAIIVSSHILSELSEFCNAIGIMEKGKMVVSGSIEQIRTSIGTKRELVVRLLDNSGISEEAFLNTLKQSAFIAEVSRIDQGHYRCNFLGTTHDAASLLAKLISLGFPVFQYAIKEANVEDIFFKIGAKEVS